MLFVSHNMGSIQQLCSRAMVLRGGVAAFDGSVSAAVSSYLASVPQAAEVVFPCDASRPSITRVAIDEAGLRSGDLVVDVQFESPFPLAPPVAGVVITTASGTPVFGSNPRFHAAPAIDDAIKSGVARVEARRLPLAPGSYRLSAWLGDWQGDYDAKPDAIAFEFNVSARVPNRPPAELIGHLDWNAIWTVHSHK